MDILTSDLLFYFFAAIAVIASILVVVKRNPVSSAMCMAISFAAAAGIMFILGAHFLGVIQILVYTGAIMVLFLFIIMLLNVKAEESSFRRPVPMIVGIIIVVVFMLQLGGVIYSIPGAKDTHRCPLAGSKCENLLSELSISNDKKDVAPTASSCDHTKHGDNACPSQIYLNFDKGQIANVSLSKAYDRFRKEQVETLNAVRQPVIIVNEDDNTSTIALETVSATASGKDISVREGIIFMDVNGDVIDQIIKDSNSMPAKLIEEIANKKPQDQNSCDIAQPIIGGADGPTSIFFTPKVVDLEVAPIAPSRPVGSSPRMYLPELNPVSSSLNYPVGTAIRNAIDKGEFPDTALLGQQIFLKYNSAFMIVGLSLLVATIGVVVLCRKYKKD